MFRILNHRLLKISQHCVAQKLNSYINNRIQRLSIITNPKVAILSIGCAAISAMSSDTSMIDVNEDLNKALVEGDAALLKLIEQLKEFVSVVSKEYRACLVKQIEITDKALNVGPLSDAWDEIPHYRSLASQLLKELREYQLLFDTIGQMASDRSLDELVSGSTKDMSEVTIRYKELEVLVRKEFEENKKVEMALLEKHRDSILYDAVTESDL
nr:unnamed protein product [Callosobruchus analis]